MERLPLLANAARWSYAEDQQQFVAARQPSTVDLLMSGFSPGKIAWAYFQVSFASPRAGLESLFVLSLHLDRERAKKPEAPAMILREVGICYGCFI